MHLHGPYCVAQLGSYYLFYKASCFSLKSVVSVGQYLVVKNEEAVSEFRIAIFSLADCKSLKLVLAFLLQKASKNNKVGDEVSFVSMNNDCLSGEYGGTKEKTRGYQW